MKKCTINQQKLPREKKETTKHDVHTLSKPSKAVSTRYSKFGHSVPKDLCQKWKNVPLTTQRSPDLEKETPRYVAHTLSRPSTNVYTTYRIFGHGRPWDLCQK